MKLDKLDKLVKQAREKKLTPGEFGQMLCSPPHNLTPPEATPLMQGYARSFTSAVARAAVRPLPSPAPVEEKPTVESAAPGSLSIINRSAVKQYALRVSTQLRAGKFTRVSSEFLDGVQATLESVIRGLAQSGGDDVTPDADADWFINGRTVRMAEEQLNAAVRAIVAGKVRRHPSVGCTLK